MIYCLKILYPTQRKGSEGLNSGFQQHFQQANRRFFQGLVQEDTETLTENGWKHYSDIEENEKGIATQP